MAKDYTLITALLNIAIRCLFAYQRKMAKRVGQRRARPAAVTFVQRWGRVVNSHVHFHVLLPDGVFVLDEGGETLRLIPLAPPSDADVLELTQRIAHRVTRFCQNHFVTVDDIEGNVLESAIAEAMRKLPVFSAGEEATADDVPEGAAPLRISKRCATISGFSVQANTAVAATNRSALENLCR